MYILTGSYEAVASSAARLPSLAAELVGDGKPEV